MSFELLIRLFVIDTSPRGFYLIGGFDSEIIVAFLKQFLKLLILLLVLF